MDLPIPAFRVGDTVFLAGTEFRSDTAQCPDCLGTRKWKAVSPAGEEFETTCPRCNGDGALKSPGEHKPVTRSLTIGSVRIDTASKEKPISYMCRETGVGSGTVYDEERLFAHEANAMAAATDLARSANERISDARKRDRELKLNLFDLPYRDARIKEAQVIERGTRSKYNRLVERICELDSLPFAGGEFINEPCPELSREQVRGVQNYLCWLDEDAKAALIESRGDD